MNKKLIINGILVAAALVVFYLIYKKIDWNETAKSLNKSNFSWIFLSLIISLSGHILRGIRWNMLTIPAGYTLNNRRSVYAVLVGYLVNLGTSRGGEIARCALASKSEKAPVETLVGTVVVERIVDFFMLVFFFILCLVFQFNYIWNFVETYIIKKIETIMPIWFFIAIILFIGFIVFYFIKRRKQNETAITENTKPGIFQKFASGLNTIFNLQNPYKFILYSLLIWSTYWLSGWCVLKALPDTNHFEIFAGLSLLVFSAMGIAIPLPAGAGVWAVISQGLQIVYHLPQQSAETFGILNLAVLNIGMLFFGLIALLLWSIENGKLNKNAGI